jgi:hypothetical protein
MTIIFNMLAFDNTTKVNCQVSPVSHVWFCLVNCDPQGRAYYELCKHLVLCDRGTQHLIPHYLLSSYLATLPSVPLHC